MTISTRCIEPPPHLLKQWVQAAREAEKKGGPYAKTFAMAAIDWAMNSQPTSNNLQIRSSEIVPPLELVLQWLEDGPGDGEFGISKHIATQAAQWGADMELEACCTAIDEVSGGWADSRHLRHVRRPKPPSLKELAQAELDRLIALIPTEGAMAMAEPIRRALEKLDD